MMTNLFRFSPLLLAFFLQTAPKVEPGFTPLFNGKDFTGWKVQEPTASWTIENGAMKANGQPSHVFYDGEFRKHMFRDFELMVDVMTRDNSNGGIYVLTEWQEKSWPKKGFEIQVNNSYVKDRVKTGSLYHVQDVLDNSPAKDDEWFTEHIIVKGDTITIRVNGKETVTWKQPGDWNGGREGAGRSITGPGTIALQAHDANSTVFYRNIRIKPLD
jgi:hypothetical protein